jgi:penicillin amidase
MVLGHNGRIAWGLTTTGADTQDLFVERPDPADPRHYLTPDGSLPFETRREVIAVLDMEDVEITVRESRHGPIISDVVADTGYGEPLALRWTALDADDTSPQGLVKLDAAQNWDDFLDASRDIHAPQQNVVYADVDGNIGFYAPARVPIRKAGDGSAPVAGWTGDHDWVGYVPFDALPHSFNPLRGTIVTANNKIVPDDYRYLIARDWAPPYRARRIEELIARQSWHTPETFRVIQTDIVSLMARDMLPHLAAAEPDTEAGRNIQVLAAGWDGAMAADRPEPLIFWAWYRALTRLVYADEFGDLFGGAWRPRPVFMRWVLGGDGSHWCDDISTDTAENCAIQTAAALDKAAAELSVRYGNDPAAWRWGDAHAADHSHPVFRKRALLDALFGYSQPNGGDHYTINAAGFTLGNASEPFTQIHGPALRAIYDLADLDRSLFVLSTGQSGHPLSPHYRDTAERWLTHRPFEIPTSRAAIEGPRLELTPR